MVTNKFTPFYTFICQTMEWALFVCGLVNLIYLLGLVKPDALHVPFNLVLQHSAQHPFKTSHLQSLDVNDASHIPHSTAAHSVNGTWNNGVFLNGADFSLNSINSTNSENLINHWCIRVIKDPLSYLCLPGTVLASLSLTQEVAENI